MAPEAQMVERGAQSWLQSSCQVQVPFAWLQACVQWLQEEAGGAGLTQQQINQQVYDQWLLTDLRDLDHPVLPEGLAQSQKTLLRGIFCVQVDSVLDVSQPAYAQLQKAKGTDCSNDEVSAVTQFTQRPWESRPSRMLLLQLTDGVQNMEAMEYKPISALSTALRPGVKLRLQGDIRCRLGLMLLGPDNVKLLGGEVEELVERNQQGRVLCRALGQPEEEEPEEEEPEENHPPAAQLQPGEPDDVDDQELLASMEAQEQAERHGGASSSRDSGYRTHFESTQSSGSATAWINGSTASSRTAMSTSSSRNSLLPSSSSSSRARSSTWSPRPEEPDFSDQTHPDPSVQDQSMADEDFDDLPLDELDSVIFQPPPAATTTPSSDFPTDEDMDFTEAQPPGLNSTEINRDVTSRITLTSPPFTYLCLWDSAKTDGAEIVVKAFIVTLLGKLSSSDGLWQVSATISDGTGYLDVELCDEVLRALLGFSAAEKAAMRRDAARRGELEAGMRRCQEGLVDMCCLMRIRASGSGRAVVTRAEALTEQDLEALETRARAAL